MSEFLIGEALLGKDSEVAHIDLMLGDKTGPVGQAFATALINMSKGHTPLLAVVRPNLMPKPAVVIVPKVTIQNLEDAGKIFGPAQAAVAKAVADCVEEGLIPQDKLDDWVIVACVFIHPESKDERKIYKYNYSATRLAIKRALDKYPSAKKLMEEKDRARHPFSSVKMPRLWRPPYLQIALDNPSLSSALSIIKQAPRSDRIIWEAGTPLVKKYGVEVVKELRKETKDGFIVADLKTLDVGKVEVDMAFDADADAAVVSGLAAVDSIDKFLLEADRMGIYGIIDMMNVADPLALLKQLKRAPRVVIIHRGIDMEGSVKKNKWEVIAEIKAMYRDIKPPVLCAVAGGITPENMGEAAKNKVDIIIVGRYITQSQDVERSIRNFINAMPGDADVDLKRIHSDDDDKGENLS
ncbi:MAG: bifunctional 5,6,7,8-tetrahydromethanopterin hydro-lyase/3-hexulose-6-phosphate synthase [Candidatus Lokiarchaeota archaeon]|nr:bifunctional 5,6,7,8-tetrahydromethanopterin hydro-lyase/3-hexulose-6-phosphate synthase [Candidatus Lokiarchaeota archaeon]